MNRRAKGTPQSPGKEARLLKYGTEDLQKSEVPLPLSYLEAAHWVKPDLTFIVCGV